MFAKPRKASTIAVVRDSESGPEVLIMKRGSKDRFLPSYYVFPGGALDPQDSEVQYNSLKLYENLNPMSRDNLMMHLAASVRETFEESGILLAYDKNGDLPETAGPGLAELFHEYRHMIINRKISFTDFMTKEKLVPAYNMIHYLSRWVTPAFSPIRYDARFFVAECPPNQNINHDGNELVESTWIKPSHALKKHMEGRMKMVLPTLSTLEFLQDFNSVNAIRQSFVKKEIETPLTDF